MAFSDYNMSLIAGLTSDVFSPFSGKANGDVHVSSKAGKIIPKGAFVVAGPFLLVISSFFVSSLSS